MLAATTFIRIISDRTAASIFLFPFQKKNLKLICQNKIREKQLSANLAI